MNHNITKKYVFLSFLTVFCSILLTISHVVQNRVISLGHIYATATIFVYPLTCWVLDIVAEVYGYKEARKTLWLSIFATFIFAIPVFLFTLAPAPSFWNSYDKVFDVAMSQILRVTFISSIAIVAGQSVNIYLVSKLRILVKGRFFALRSIFSSILGDTLTILIAVTGFFIGRMNGHQILTIAITEPIIMYTFAFILAFPGSIIVNILKTIEPENTEDFIKFNPFKIN